MLSSVYKEAVVPYTQQQMFSLVNEVAMYPEFVPACDSTEIHSQDEEHIEATLTFVGAGMHKSFTTRNELEPMHTMIIHLVDGPFKTLHGIWHFEMVEENQCKVSLNLEFEISGQMLSMVFGPIFHQIANKLVDAFVRRAHEVYGAND